MGRFVQTINVGLFFEDPVVVDTDALKDAIPVQEPMVEHGDLGIRLIHK